MSAHCKYCDRDFRSTTEREKSGVCSICYSLYSAIVTGIKFVGKNSVDKILKAAENDSTAKQVTSR